ncbi:hypothetical protein B0H34DRAFT_724557 [Crassisporium funariophilum]|nr:hypothetical protein B0H34DRAFT_724557 [Crassisporium funariophilum]
MSREAEGGGRRGWSERARRFCFSSILDLAVVCCWLISQASFKPPFPRLPPHQTQRSVALSLPSSKSLRVFESVVLCLTFAFAFSFLCLSSLILRYRLALLLPSILASLRPCFLLLRSCIQYHPTNTPPDRY